jgi:hypothetical protein
VTKRLLTNALGCALIVAGICVSMTVPPAEAVEPTPIQVSQPNETVTDQAANGSDDAEPITNLVAPQGTVAPVAYSNYTSVYEVTTKTYYDSKANCVDRNQDTTTKSTCTLRQAIVQANNNTSTDKILITLDPDFATQLDPATSGSQSTNPWIQLVGTNLMCDRVAGACNDLLEEDTRDSFWIKHPNLTIDFEGLLGVAWSSGDEYGTFLITASGVTLKGFNGLYSPGAAVVLMTGADDFTMIDGSTNQRRVATVIGSNGKPVANATTNNYFTERWLVVAGSVHNITAKNWEIGGLYQLNTELNGAVIFENATVDGFTIDNVTFDATTNGSTCTFLNADGCSMNGWQNHDRNVLKNFTITNSTFKGFSGGNRQAPFAFDYKDHKEDLVVLWNWTLDHDTFSDNQGTEAAIARLENAVIGIDIDSETNPEFGLKVTNCTFEGSTLNTKGLWDAADSEVANVTFQNNIFKNNRITKDMRQGFGLIWTGSAGDTDGFTFEGNELTSNTAEGQYSSALSFSASGQATNIAITGNTSNHEAYSDAWLWLAKSPDADPDDQQFSDISVTGNTWTNLKITTTGKTVIALPQEEISGTNTITGNTVQSTSTAGNLHFVNWAGGARDNNSTASSKLSITDNKLSGFTGSAIRIGAHGVTEIRRRRQASCARSITSRSANRVPVTGSKWSTDRRWTDEFENLVPGPHRYRHSCRCADRTGHSQRCNEFCRMARLQGCNGRRHHHLRTVLAETGMPGRYLCPDRGRHRWAGRRHRRAVSRRP